MSESNKTPDLKVATRVWLDLTEDTTLDDVDGFVATAMRLSTSEGIGPTRVGVVRGDAHYVLLAEVER